MASLYHQYYDKLYSQKDYRGEVETVLGTAEHVLGRFPARVLDVGCGTGTHSLLLSEQGCDVVGVDIDAEAIEIAQSKAKGKRSHPPCFLSQDVGSLANDGFDLAISMFNVVNYLDGIDAATRFFEAVHSRLVKDGIYIFDCWNGLAAILDPPQRKHTELTVGEEVLTVTTVPEVDLINQVAIMKNDVAVTSVDGRQLAFNYTYQSRLWTPWMIGQLLSSVGLDVIRMSQWMSCDEEADEHSWKMMVVARRSMRPNA